MQNVVCLDHFLMDGGGLHVKNQEGSLSCLYVFWKDYSFVRLETTGKHCYWVDLCNPWVGVALLTNHLLLESGTL